MSEEQNEQIVYWAPWIDRSTGQRENKSTVSEWLYKEPSSVWRNYWTTKTKTLFPAN